MKKKKKYKTKTQMQAQHFQKRCIERIGTALSNKELTKLIQDNKLPFVDRQSCRVTHWLYTHTDGKQYILVYDKQRQKVVTILFYKQYLEKQEQNEV